MLVIILFYCPLIWLFKCCKYGHLFHRHINHLMNFNRHLSSMFQAGVEMNVTAPFFNDPKPDGPSGQPFYGLWDYEGEFLRPPRVVRGALLASPFLCFPSFASSVSGGMPLILIFSFSFSFGMFSRSYYSLFPFLFIVFSPPHFRSRGDVLPQRQRRVSRGGARTLGAAPPPPAQGRPQRHQALHAPRLHRSGPNDNGRK